MREAEIESANGVIRIPGNCGQQLYDVIDVTDSRAGLSAEEEEGAGANLGLSTEQGTIRTPISIGSSIGLKGVIK